MILLSTAWFPPVEWMHHFLKNEAVCIEAHENFVKQSYRSRCTISSANGRLDLSIPLQNDSTKMPITEKKISYADSWQAKHWRAIESAYSNSPYFEYFEHEIKQALFSGHELLFDFNMQALHCVLHILRIRKEVNYTTHYETAVTGTDLRYSISPKEKSGLQFPEYYQVFRAKNGFLANLSVLDLLFNEGLESIAYLKDLA